MQDKLKPALIGGVALGVASSIPFVNMVNCLCCAWVIAGGLVAAYLYQQQPPRPLPPASPWGDAVLLGLLTGAIGAVVAVILSIPFNLMMGQMGMFGNFEQLQEALREADLPPEVVEALDSVGAQAGLSCFGLLFGLLFSLIVYPVFATIGSLVGTALFQRRAV